MKLNIDLDGILRDFLHRNKSEFEEKLIHIDDERAHCSGIDIVNVESEGGFEYRLNYKYNWSIYHGCDDINEYRELEESVLLTLHEDGEVEFHFLELEERSTYDEF